MGRFFSGCDYLEYHADRFPDCSYLFFLKGKVIALLPAHRRGDMLCSHAGLTYGGLILSPSATSERVLTLFDLMAEELPRDGITRLLYKCVPYHLHRYPAEEDRYALFRKKAVLTACNIASGRRFVIADTFQRAAASRCAQGAGSRRFGRRKRCME